MQKQFALDPVQRLALLRFQTLSLRTCIELVSADAVLQDATLRSWALLSFLLAIMLVGGLLNAAEPRLVCTIT